MKRTRRELEVNGRTFTILEFTREKGDPELNDQAVQMAATEERLQPITADDVKDFCAIINGKPTKPIVAFGTVGNGSEATGSFPGVWVLNTKGEVELEQNWTRGQTGDLWEGEREFIFTPVA